MPADMKSRGTPPVRHGFSSIPAPLFGAALGLTGLSLAWQRAEGMGFLSANGVSGVLLILAGMVSLLIFSGYGLKLARMPNAVRADMLNPARVTSLGAAPMTLMLLPAGMLPYLSPQTGGLGLVWLVGALAHLGLATWLVARWMRVRPKLSDVTPAWFVPLVGMAVAASAGGDLGYGALATGITLAGAIAWIALLPFVMWRLVAGPALPDALVPTVFVLVAPPALVALGLGSLADPTSDTAMLAAAFFYVSCVFLVPVTAVIARRVMDITALGFTHGWWSATFPLAALASAGMQTQAMLPTAAHHAMAMGALALVTLVTATVGLVSLRSIIQRP